VQTAVASLRNEPIPTSGSWLPLPPKDDARVVGFSRPIERSGIGESQEERSGLGPAGSAGDKRQTVVNFARAQLGEKYVFGATGPDTWDCSGLTMRAYQQVGIKLPHNAAMQQLSNLGKNVSSPSLGDLIFWGTFSGHVGIYSGNGNMIHAPNSRRPVTEEKIHNLHSAKYRSYL
jgi:cell wall-associated NlpC family hydrolase